MVIVITMAGAGSRFRNVGYNCPKFMIEVKGRTLFEWSMDSLINYFPYCSKIIFVSRKEDKAKNFIFEKMKRYKLEKIEIIELEEMTDGQASTAYIGMQKCSSNEAVLVYNIDTYIEPDALKYAELKGDGHIPCFHANGNHWSFVKGENGVVFDVAEKNRISNNCSLGIYYFKKISDYIETYRMFDFSHYNKEKYIAPMYNFLLNQKKNITFSIIDNKKVHVLGTPEELEEFKKI